MKSELTRYKEALSWVLGSPLSGNSQLVKVSVHQILDPPPEMETVSFTIWQMVDQNNTSRGWYPDFKPTLSNSEAEAGFRILQFECQDQRPKKQPVERSVSAGDVVLTSGNVLLQTFPKILGKTGTLTFTWTEDPT